MSLEIKKGDRIIFAVDRSGSMATEDCDGATRYLSIKESIEAFLTGGTKFNDNGVSLYFFNNRVDSCGAVHDVPTLDKFFDANKTGGGTSTNLAIEAGWQEHKKGGGDSTFLLIFTDGEPSDPQAVKDEIVNITKQMKGPEEFRMLFATVGVRTPALSTFLGELDSDLKGAAFDIVGVAELAGLNFEEAIAELIGSSTTDSEAAKGAGYQGKGTAATN